MKTLQLLALVSLALNLSILHNQELLIWLLKIYLKTEFAV